MRLYIELLIVHLVECCCFTAFGYALHVRSCVACEVGPAIHVSWIMHMPLLQPLLSTRVDIMPCPFSTLPVGDVVVSLPDGSTVVSLPDGLAVVRCPARR